MSANGVTTDAKGNVYVVGNGFTGSNGHWLVRMSSNGGDTWRTIDDLLLDGGGGANSLMVDSTGRLDVLGEIYDSADVAHLVLRRSSDDGATWVNVDNFLYGAANSDGTYGGRILALPDCSTLVSVSATMSGGGLSSGWLVRHPAGAAAKVTPQEAETSSISAAGRE